jgi:hypothetical protein
VLPPRVQTLGDALCTLGILSKKGKELQYPLDHGSMSFGIHGGQVIRVRVWTEGVGDRERLGMDLD